MRRTAGCARSPRRACRAERLDLQQLNAFRDQVGLKRLDESAADTPAVQSAVSRNQVDLGRARKMTGGEQHPDCLAVGCTDG